MSPKTTATPREIARLRDQLERAYDYSRYLLVHGVLQHTLYHAGQIALLKRATAG